MIFHQVFCSALLLFSTLAFAQNRNIKINPKKPVKIEYISPAWNKSSEEIDHDAIVLRDSESGKVVRVELAETGVNTGIFVGDYVVTWSGQDFHPEVYIVPQEMLKSSEQMKKINSLIADGTLVKKPIFFQTGSRMQKISVFDTRDQAIAAYDEFRRTRLQSQTPVTREALEAQDKAQKIAADKAAQVAAAAVQVARKSIEDEEKTKQASLLAEQGALAEKEKTRRVEKAKVIAAEAMEEYKKSNFVQAEKLFNLAVELDPSNSAFYYQYGVTLYKNENYNKSVVILGLAKGDDINETEKSYFLALNHMKLGEQDQAVTMLDQVTAKNDKTLSPPAAFYSGVIRYQKEDFDKSKANFEYVLDNSQEPEMDKQAENYIEQIANILIFKKAASKKFILTLYGGLTYDSNILYLSSSTQSNLPSGLEGYRWSYGTSLEYRPIYTQTNEFSAILGLSDMYSEDKNFQPSSSFQNTDPLDMTIATPYRYKGTAFGRAYQMTLTPMYENIHMNIDGEGARESITDSEILKNDHTFAMSENWFSTYSIELRHDQSYVSASSSDSQTENRVTLTTQQTRFIDSKKTQGVIGTFALSQNNAEGENQTYSRFDLGASYYAPSWWNSTWTTALYYYNANYTKHLTGRKDNDYNFNLGWNKSLTERLSLNLIFSYTNNNSTDATSKYDKFTVMSGLTWVGAF